MYAQKIDEIVSHPQHVVWTRPLLFGCCCWTFFFHLNDGERASWHFFANKAVTQFSYTKAQQKQHSMLEKHLFLALEHVSECPKTKIWLGMMTRPNQQGLWQSLGYGILKMARKWIGGKRNHFYVDFHPQFEFWCPSFNFFLKFLKKLVHFDRPLLLKPKVFCQFLIWTLSI